MNIDLHVRLRALAPLVLAAAMVAPAAHATTVFDNAGASQDGADPIQSYGPLAISFTNGAVAATLSSVGIVLASDSAAFDGTLDVELLSDDGTSPGSVLATLATLPAAAVSTAGFSLYDFVSLAPTVLAANTTYWIELVANGASALEWSWSGDISGTGVAAGSSYSQEFGVLANSDGGPYQAVIDVTPLAAVPEPATGSLLALGLGVLGVFARRTRRATTLGA